MFDLIFPDKISSDSIKGKNVQKKENNPYMHVCDDVLLKIYVKIMSDYIIFSIEFDIISSTNVGCRSLD